jgi:hypothetical protein
VQQLVLAALLAVDVQVAGVVERGDLEVAPSKRTWAWASASLGSAMAMSFSSPRPSVTNGLYSGNTLGPRPGRLARSVGMPRRLLAT